MSTRPFRDFTAPSRLISSNICGMSASTRGVSGCGTLTLSFVLTKRPPTFAKVPQPLSNSAAASTSARRADDTLVGAFSSGI